MAQRAAALDEGKADVNNTGDAFRTTPADRELLEIWAECVNRKRVVHRLSDAEGATHFGSVQAAMGQESRAFALGARAPPYGRRRCTVVGLPMSQAKRVALLGDSTMLGIAAALRAFLERSNCAVVSNRHMAGARLRDVIEAAQAVPPVDTLGIFLCGNDIMRGTPPADLQQAVDVLGAIARQKAQRLCVFMGGAGIWDNAPPSYEGHMERF